MLSGYKPVEVEIQINGARRRIRVQVDVMTLKDTAQTERLLGNLFSRLRHDMKTEGIF